MKNLLLLLCGVLLAGCATHHRHHERECCCCNCGGRPMSPGAWQPGQQPPSPGMPSNSWQKGPYHFSAKPRHAWTSQEKPAPGYMEFKLRNEGKHWTKVDKEIKVGSIVQDIYEPRMDQPVGRGAIGKVVEVLKGDRGQKVARVDFGNHYIAAIQFSELSAVKISKD